LAAPSKCESSLVTNESVRSGICSFNRSTTWRTAPPLTNPAGQYSVIVSRGSRENLVVEKRCLNGPATPSEATHITAERQKRQQLRHCSRCGSILRLILLHCAVYRINRHRQSMCISHKKDSWQPYGNRCRIKPGYPRIWGLLPQETSSHCGCCVLTKKRCSPQVWRFILEFSSYEA